jgi:S1-C subfamily serine protease
MSPSAPVSGTLAALSGDLADAVELIGRSVVAVHARRRIPSTGLVWRDEFVVAANHTVTRDEDISLTLPDGRSERAMLVGRDPSTDLAVLRTESSRLPPPQRAQEEELQVGRMVLAVGRPGTQATASLGIISAVGGEWRTWQGGRIDRFVRLDLSIYDGFSGSPLVAAGGRVLGINTSGLSRATALTIPLATVERVGGQLIERGHIRRGYLGLAVQPVRLPESIRRSVGVEGPIGLLVINLEPGGPADRAGLLLGDIITGVDGRPVADPTDLLAALAAESVGKQLSLRLLRGGAAMTVSVIVGERPGGKEKRG